MLIEGKAYLATVEELDYPDEDYAADLVVVATRKIHITLPQSYTEHFEGQHEAEVKGKLTEANPGYLRVTSLEYLYDVQIHV